MITPQEFSVSDKLVRKRLHLSRYTRVEPYGCEEVFKDKVLCILKKHFDAGSLFLRTRPDFVIINKKGVYFVEAKQRSRNVEAIQLLYNKFYEKLGIKVIYSFPEVAISAALIPMKKIIIPQNYRHEFDVNLKHLFEVEGISEFVYVGDVTHGSGDAFVPVNLEELKTLSEELLSQEELC